MQEKDRKPLSFVADSATSGREMSNNRALDKLERANGPGQKGGSLISQRGACNQNWTSNTLAIKQADGGGDKCRILMEDPEEAPEVEDDDGKNLDSGYAWCILLIMFLLQASIGGSSRVYGIVYAQEVSLGYYDRQQASWPIATSSAIENLAGLLTPALANYLSWRQLELLSAILFIIANLASYFSDSLCVDILALGLVQGLALSTSTVLSLAINNDYFERYRTTAYGISMSGSAFGVLYLSPIVSWLLDKYEGQFRLIYLMLAIVFCTNVVLVLFIKPRVNPSNNAQISPKSSQVCEKATGSGGFRQQSIATICSAKSDLHPKMSDTVGEEEDEDANRRNRLSVVRKISRFEERFERKNSIASISYEIKARRQSSISKAVEMKREQPQAGPSCAVQCLCRGKSGADLIMRKKSINCVKNLERRKYSRQESYCNNLEGRESPTKDANEGWHDIHCHLANSNNNFDYANRKLEDLDQNQKQAREERGEKMGGRIESLGSFLQLKLDFESQPEVTKEQPVLDNNNNETKSCAEICRKNSDQFSWNLTVKLLKSPYLHCTWIMLSLYYLIARIFVIILVDFANDHGCSLRKSTQLLNYWSFGELFGRIFLGSLIDLQYLSCKICICLTCLFLSMAIIVMVMVESYYVYAACSTIVAALVSLEYMLINVLMVEYLGKHSVTSCYSLAAFISSAILFARPTMIGLFRDHLGSYDGLLLLLAALALVFATLLFILEPIFVAHWPRPKTNLSATPMKVDEKSYIKSQKQENSSL